MLREIEKPGKKCSCSPLHKVHARVCYKRLYESAIQHQQCACKSVAVPPQPGCRNSGKTETRLCSQIEQERRNRVRK